MKAYEIAYEVKQKMGSDYPKEFTFKDLKGSLVSFYFLEFPYKNSIYENSKQTTKEDIDAIVKRVYLMKEMRLKWY